MHECYIIDFLSRVDLQDRLRLVSSPVMGKLTGMRTLPEDCLIAEVALPSDHIRDDALLSKSGPRQLVLAGVQDPGNMVNMWFAWEMI